MSVSMANTSQSRSLVSLLAESGVSHAVVSPGSRNTPLLLALQKHSEIKIHVVLDERTAGFFALGLARASGSPVILSCTSGSAGAHYLPAVIEAFHSRVPLIVLTANRPHELHDAGAPQTVSQDRFFEGFVRYYRQLNVPGDGTPNNMLRGIVSQAMKAGMGRPNGPVHLDCPFREPLWSQGDAVQVDGPDNTAISRTRCSLVPSQEKISQIAERLKSVRRGALVVGPMNGCSDINDAAHNLAKRLGWPILAEPTSSIQAHENDEENLVVTAADAIVHSDKFTEKNIPELIFRVGPVPTSKRIALWTATIPCLLLDEAGSTLDPTHSVLEVIEGAPANVLEAIATNIPESSETGEWLKLWKSANSTAQKHLTSACDDGFWEGSIARAVMKSLPDNAMLHVASSMPIRDLSSFGGARRKALTTYSSRGANGIDGTIATALGEAHIHDGPALLICGDLALLHDIGSLLASKNLDSGLVVLVVDNSGGGIFHALPISDHKEVFEQLFVTPQNIDIGALCDGAGINNVEVSSADELETAIERAIESIEANISVSVITAKVSRYFSVEQRKQAFNSVDAALAQLSEGGL